MKSNLSRAMIGRACCWPAYRFLRPKSSRERHVIPRGLRVGRSRQRGAVATFRYPPTLFIF